MVLPDALRASANVGGVNFGDFDPILPVVVTIVDVKSCSARFECGN